MEVGTVIREAYRLQDSTPAEVNPKRMLEPFIPLTRGQYPIFNKYPKFIVDYQVNFLPSNASLCLVPRPRSLEFIARGSLGIVELIRTETHALPVFPPYRLNRPPPGDEAVLL